MRSLKLGHLALVATALLTLTAGDALAKKPVVKKEYSGSVNLNTATQAQLDQLPGVGEKAARRIIEHRSKAPFSRPEELTRVKGFGPKKMKALRPLVTVSGPTNLQVRRAAPGLEASGSTSSRAGPTSR